MFGEDEGVVVAFEDLGVGGGGGGGVVGDYLDVLVEEPGAVCWWGVSGVVDCFF